MIKYICALQNLQIQGSELPKGYISMNFTCTVCTDQQTITAKSVSSHNLTLRLDAVQTAYRCLLSTGGLGSVSVNVTGGETVTVTVRPDTMYTIGCVSYDEQRQDLCVEANTTTLFITREQRHIACVCMYITMYTYIQSIHFSASTYMFII